MGGWGWGTKCLRLRQTFTYMVCVPRLSMSMSILWRAYLLRSEYFRKIITHLLGFGVDNYPHRRKHRRLLITTLIFLFVYEHHRHTFAHTHMRILLRLT